MELIDLVNSVIIFSKVVFSLVVSKVFEKLVNDRLVNHLEKCDLFSNFQYGFRSSRSTAGLLKVVSDKIARAFKRFGAAGAVTFDISKAFVLDIWPYFDFFQ